MTSSTAMGSVSTARGRPGCGRRNTAGTKEAVQAYLATITFVDDCIGVLLDGLAQSKYADNTIVMLWGDQAGFWREKQRLRQDQLWQVAPRAPDGQSFRG